MSLNGNTLAFPSRPAMITPLAGLPADLRLDPGTLEVAALAVADLSGRRWSEMTPSEREELRQWTLLAAVASHPEGLRLIGYSMARTLDGTFGGLVSGPDRSGRLARVDGLMGALRGASSRVSGVCDREVHNALVHLIALDVHGVTWR